MLGLTSRSGRSSSTEAGGAKSLFPASMSCFSSSPSAEAIVTVCPSRSFKKFQNLCPKIHTMKPQKPQRKTRTLERERQGCFENGQKRSRELQREKVRVHLRKRGEGEKCRVREKERESVSSYSAEKSPLSLIFPLLLCRERKFNSQREKTGVQEKWCFKKNPAKPVFGFRAFL